MDAKTTNLFQAAAWAVEDWRNGEDVGEAMDALTIAVDDMDIEDEAIAPVEEED